MHALHAFAPLSSWYSPAGHLVQMLASGLALKVPGAQAVALSDQVGQKVPAAHAMQSSFLVITSCDELVRRPAGHGSGADAPSPQ